MVTIPIAVGALLAITLIAAVVIALGETIFARLDP